MNFRSFLGNPETVRQLQESVASSRVPHSILLTGPRGSGKYSLALALAQTLNCTDAQTTNGLPDACDVCENCTQIAASLDLDARIAEAVETREELRDVDRKETRVLVQTHPDVLILPPDPPQNLVKLGQVRSLIQNIQRSPAEGRRRKIYIFPKSAFMNEAANALLKVLEEPPEYAHLLLLAENPSDLLPTIRSRTSKMRLHALPESQMESLLFERHPDWQPERRTLVARLSEGAVGRALSFDTERYLGSRKDALLLLRTAVAEPDHSALFRMTETYRAGADGQQKTQDLLRAMYTLLEDIMLLQAAQHNMARNIDILPELRRIAGGISFDWIERTARNLADVESGMRRNLLRSLSLDALAAHTQPL